MIAARIAKVEELRSCRASFHDSGRDKRSLRAGSCNRSRAHLPTDTALGISIASAETVFGTLRDSIRARRLGSGSSVFCNGIAVLCHQAVMSE